MLTRSTSGVSSWAKCWRSESFLNLRARLSRHSVMTVQPTTSFGAIENQRAHKSFAIKERELVMSIRIGINGFGRIGRQVYKAIRERYDQEIDVVAVNDIGRIKIMTHLLKYDTNYGRFPGEVVSRDDGLVDNGDASKVLADRDPSRRPRGKLGVEIVIESTGLFRQREKAKLHLDSGAK